MDECAPDETADGAQGVCHIVLAITRELRSIRAPVVVWQLELFRKLVWRHSQDRKILRRFAIAVHGHDRNGYARLGLAPLVQQDHLTLLWETRKASE